MRLYILVVPTLFLLSCDDPSTKKTNATSRGEHRKTVVFQVPINVSETVRTLWQRSYPKDYSDLLARAKESRSGEDPFAEPIETPDSELTPGTFGLLGWDRAIVPRVFDELGYPLKDGDSAHYDAGSGRFRITHSPSAINSFRTRFPEFKQIPSEQADVDKRASSLSNP